MDKDKREDKKRDAPNVAETKKKDQFKSLFAQLRALLQTHGYPVKGDREKKLQSTSALSQKKEDQVNPETSKAISNWIPSFHSYEDFNRRTLQSLGGFIIILSTDGVIISVAENISSLLGYLPDEIVGKKLLSLLPDQEKREVFQKICLKFPVSNSEKHMEFCCHLKRGNLQSGGNLTYEYAKFILTIKDISDEPVVLLSRFFPSPNYIESSTTQLPLEDRFYIVGTVCILRSQTLRELLTVQETSKDIEIIELSDEDNSSILILLLLTTVKRGIEACNKLHFNEGPDGLFYRNLQDQRTSSGMEPLPAESAVVALKDQVDIVEAEQYGLQESAHIPCDISISSPETTQSSATSSLQHLELEPEVEEVDNMGEVEQVAQRMDQMNEMEKMEQEVKQVEDLEQENLAPHIYLDRKLWKAPDFHGRSQFHLKVKKPLKIPPLVAAYINKREMELMKKFRKHLEKTTQMLQADIRNQKAALEMMKEQLNTLQGSKFQMQPTTLHHVDSYEPQFLEPAPKKQCTKQMERSFTDPSETKRFRVSHSSHSLKFSELFKEPCNASTQIQSIDVPLQLAAEQQDNNLGGQEDKSQSFIPEDQQEQNLLPLAYSPNSEMISSASFSQSPSTSDSDSVTLETIQDYIRLWQLPSDEQNHVNLQVNTWPCSEEDQSTGSEQALAPEAEAQGPSGSPASQDPAENPPNQISCDLPAEQSNSDE